MRNFYMDESGHDGKNSPLIVVGGFAIDSQHTSEFEQEVKDLYFHCFGVIYDGFKELNGSDLLANQKFKNALALPKMSDEVRRIHVDNFLNGQKQMRPSQKDFVAFAQAGILFVETLFDLLTKYECDVFACMMSKEEFKKETKLHAVSDILEEFENRIYQELKKVFNFNRLEAHFYVDKTEEKDDLRRKKLFESIYTQDADFKLDFIDSKSSLMIQIADIIIYCMNYGLRGFDKYENAEAKNALDQCPVRKEIAKIVEKHTTWWFDAPLYYTMQQFHWYDGNEITALNYFHQK